MQKGKVISIITASGIMLGFLVAMPAYAHMNGNANATIKTHQGARLNLLKLNIKGNGGPVVAGKVTAVFGSAITITNQSNVTYAIDAASAQFVVKGVESPTISNVAVGDTLLVQGSFNGMNVTATLIIDQKANVNAENAPKLKWGFFGHMGGFFKHLFGF